MVSNWSKKPLKDAGVVLIDCDHRTPPAVETGYAYVAIPQLKSGRIDFSEARRISKDNFIEWTKKANPQNFDVVLSRRCNPGETAFVDGDIQFALGQNLVLLRSDGSQIYPPFLRWLVRGTEWWQQVGKFLNVGAVFDSLKCADIPKFELPIPPMNEQRAIAHVLGTLDDKIELNRRMNETLEAMARALFKSWLIDPTRNGLPEDWREGVVSEEFYLMMGQSPPGESYNERGVGIAFFQGRADFGFRYPNPRVFCTAPTRFADAGDTLVSVRAPVGDVNMAETKCCVGRGVAAVRHKSLSSSYTYYIMKSLQSVFDNFEAEGTVFGSISKVDFQKLGCVVPPSHVIEAFERFASPIDQLIENNEKESRTLAALRDALLPKLLSGELRTKASL